MREGFDKGQDDPKLRIQVEKSLKNNGSAAHAYELLWRFYKNQEMDTGVSDFALIYTIEKRHFDNNGTVELRITSMLNTPKEELVNKDCLD